MELLNANIDDDLIFNGIFNTIRRESDAGYLTVQGGSTINNGGFIRLYGDTGGGALHKKIEIGEDGNVALALGKATGFPSNFALYRNIVSDGTATLKSFPDPTGAQDLATKHYADGLISALNIIAWDDWTPTLTWGTADPASLGTNARWMQIGKTVYFSFTTFSTDSNGCSSLTISLPVSAKNISNKNTMFAAKQRYGVAGNTYGDPFAYVRHDANQDKIQFSAFQTATDGQRITIEVTGFYEVA